MDVEDEFDDLLGEIEMFQDSSQESLTNPDDDLMLDDVWDESLDADTDDPNQHDEDKDTLASSVVRDQPKPPSNRNLHSAIDNIERVIETIATQMLNGEDEIRIPLRSRSGNLGKGSKVASRDICFPGKNEKEAWRFTVVIRILELVHEALRNNVVISKRDIFYRDPALFNSQSHVDRYVDDIAFTFNVQRSMLNVTAAAKGLIAGHVTFCRRDGILVDAATDREGQLTPAVKDILSIDMEAVKWILVVEKEASFRSILSSTFGDTIICDGIIMTGKGYPDVATRALLHLLSHPTPSNGFRQPPVFGLADFDPDGIAILSIYKHGSRTMAHETVSLCCPSLHWLGLRSEHLFLSTDNIHSNQGLLHLTRRDRSRARKMLGNDDLLDDQVIRDLQVMLMLNIKAELQLLDAMPDGMSELLTSASIIQPYK